MSDAQVENEVMIRVLPTPNPNAIKFVVNRTLKNTGKATFTKPSEAYGIMLAEEIFHIEGVRQLHFFENVLTVTHAEEIDPEKLKADVSAVIQSRIVVHDPSFLTEEEGKKVDRSNLSPEIQKIEEILDRTVRTYLQGDGGDIQVLTYQNHILDLKYEGACGTCPSSSAGTLDAIHGILQEQFDPLIEINLV
jgi:Fe-S cluster biogenesis protein NfuA